MPPLTAKKLPKIGKNQEKSGKNYEKSGGGGKGKNREVSFTLPLLTDWAGYVPGLISNLHLEGVILAVFQCHDGINLRS